MTHLKLMSLSELNKVQQKSGLEIPTWDMLIAWIAKTVREQKRFRNWASGRNLQSSYYLL
jgi:hypothetical protein